MTGYLQMRHWDYWWKTYGYLDAPICDAEFSVTKDRDGEQLFFHFDIYTLQALDKFLESGEFIEKDSPDFPCFVDLASELRRGIRDYFVGYIYYKDYTPGLAGCNRYQQEGTDIFSVKSPEREPYYAVLFIREERPLLPELLIEWMEKLSFSLFHCHFTYEMANMPSYESAGKKLRESPEFELF